MTKRSTSSSTPKSPNDQRRSTTSWTTPEPGDVIAYAYLWHREHRRGQEEGLKNRPVVVVVATEHRENETLMLVAPITHAEPRVDDAAIPLPASVKRQLGLDMQPSWIVTSELNRFVWPGPDVRPVPERTPSSPLYDALPEWLYERVRQAVLDAGGRHSLKVVPRTK